ncbi:putative protein geranylgeranyltransferase type II [Helianthus debilis subsp. tardiflorus]
MHGRPRKSATPVDENASALKAAELRSLQSQFLHNHHNNIYTKEALELNAKLIEANPEFMTAWNYRKLAFEHSQSEADSDRIQAIIDEELRVVTFYVILQAFILINCCLLNLCILLLH